MLTGVDQIPPTPAYLYIGKRFSKKVTFTEDSIRAFAALAGDTNPLHYDRAAAASSPFGRIIASGTQTISMMLAVVPDFLSTNQPNLGLEASVRMLRPVRAGDSAVIEWEITNVASVAKLKGWIVTTAGRLVREDDVVALTAVSKTLIYWPGSGA
jgi:3-hydroxybutyryl-CoA dehydratase